MISLRDVVTGFGARDRLAEVWRRDLRGGGGGAAEITGVPPLQYIGDGRPLEDYTIAGNTVQDGTPTPENPVPVVGSGTDTAYGYKLPLTVNDTEYPIYLGQVETTRRIKKLVLTGEEDGWSEQTTNTFRIHDKVNDAICPANGSLGLSNMYTQVPYDFINYMSNGQFTYAKPTGSYTRLAFKNTSCADVTAWKSYLASQYAAGTPVTVWYVLAEPETAVVNEPLMKIDNYADTISYEQAGVTIPTVNGENVLDVPTEVPPSEVTIKGGISSV